MVSFANLAQQIQEQEDMIETELEEGFIDFIEEKFIIFGGKA